MTGHTNLSTLEAEAREPKSKVSLSQTFSQKSEVHRGPGMGGMDLVGRSLVCVKPDLSLQCHYQKKGFIQARSSPKAAV